MATDIGPKIGIDGEKEYRQALNNIIQQSKTLDSEMKAVTSSFTKATTAEEKNTKTKEVLTKQIEAQRSKLELQTEMLQKSSELYGENDTRTLKWKEAVNTATAALNKMQSELDGTNGELKETGKSLEDSGNNALTFGDVMKANIASEAIITGAKALASAIVSIGRAIADTVSNTLEWADNLNTLSIQTGISTDKLQELQYMSSLLDFDISTVSGGLKKLTKAMSSASSGSGSAYDSFKRLGVEFQNTDGSLRDNYDVFLEVIDALGLMTNETERDAAAMEIFGKSATDLNTIIEAGSGEMQKLAEEAQAVGYVMGEADLSKLSEAQDNLDRIKNQLTGLKNQAVLELFPAINEGLEGVLAVIRGDLSIDQILSDFKASMPELEDGVAELVSNVGVWLVDNIDDIIEAGVELGKALLTGILRGLDGIAEAIGKKLTNAWQSSIDAEVGSYYGGGTTGGGLSSGGGAGAQSVFNVYAAQGQSAQSIANEINGLLGAMY